MFQRGDGGNVDLLAVLRQTRGDRSFVLNRLIESIPLFVTDHAIDQLIAVQQRQA